MKLYAHPFASNCWKVLIALYENGTPFDYARMDDAAVAAEFAGLAPFGKMPLLVDGPHVVPETTIIIEHLQLAHGGPVELLPGDARAAMPARLLDRLSDQYLMAPMQAIVADFLRPSEQRDPAGVAQAEAVLDRAYAWWNGHMACREWATDAFGLADCAAAPALFYADWVRPIPEALEALRNYRARLLARPSVARVVDEARPFRHLFPPGAPDRD